MLIMHLYKHLIYAAHEILRGRQVGKLLSTIKFLDLLNEVLRGTTVDPCTEHLYQSDLRVDD